jgi:hypothetical protein
MESAPGPPWSGWDRADDRLWRGLAGGNEVGVRRSEERNAAPGLWPSQATPWHFGWTHRAGSMGNGNDHSARTTNITVMPTQAAAHR